MQTANTLVGDWAIRGISGEQLPLFLGTAWYWSMRFLRCSSCGPRSLPLCQPRHTVKSNQASEPDPSWPAGGQKRRVSIAVELITSPQILFLDEPTSGLDSAAAFHVLQCVRDLATNEKRTVVAVIHQPPSEVYALFDKLLLLSAGRMVYFGDADRAVELFESVGLKKNPKMSDADFFLHSINPDFAGPAGPTLLAECKDIDCNIGQLIKHFRASDRYKAIANKVDTLLTTKGEPMVMPPTTTWISKTT